MVSIFKLIGKDHFMFLFYIDSNPLITSWLKEQALVSGEKFYNLDSLREAGYFLFDLKPDVLVIESEILQNEKEYLLKAQAEYSSLLSLPLITVGRESVGGNFGMQIVGHVPKPLNPDQFFKQVKEILKLNHVH